MCEPLTRKIKADQRGSAMAFTLLVTAILMIAATAIVSVIDTDARIASAQQDRKTVQYSAEAVVQKILSKLAGDGKVTLTGPSPVTDTLTGLGDTESRYSYTIERSPELSDNQYLLTVDCQVELGNGKTADKRLRVVFQYTRSNNTNPGNPDDPGNTGGAGDSGDTGGQTPANPPPNAKPMPIDTTVFDYALVGGGTLPLTSEKQLILGPVFSNSSIQLRKGVIGTEGPVRAVGAISVVDNQELPGVVLQPNQQLPLTMPVVDWVYLREHSIPIDDKRIRVNLARTMAQVDGPSLNNNDIVFFDGNIHVTGEIPANAIIAATGDIIIYGDFKYPFAENSTVGLFAQKDINVYSRAYDMTPPGLQGPNIRGVVIAGDNIITTGEGSIEGCAIAGNQVQPGFDTFEIRYSSEAIHHFFNFATTNVIENYNDLHTSYVIPPSQQQAASANYYRTSNTSSPLQSTGVTTSATPPEVKIIRWEELN